MTLSWNAVTGATSYTIYLASQAGVTKANYNGLPNGDRRVNVMSPTEVTGLTQPGTYYFVVSSSYRFRATLFRSRYYRGSSTGGTLRCRRMAADWSTGRTSQGRWRSTSSPIPDLVPPCPCPSVEVRA